MNSLNISCGKLNSNNLPVYALIMFGYEIVTCMCVCLIKIPLIRSTVVEKFNISDCSCEHSHTDQLREGCGVT